MAKLVSRHSMVMPSRRTGQVSGTGVFLRQRPPSPSSSALVLLKMASAPSHRPGSKRWPPKRLRFRPLHGEAAKALELAPLTAVEEGIVGKAGGRDDAQAELDRTGLMPFAVVAFAARRPLLAPCRFEP